MEKREILGVRHRERLPRGWSFPVGAEAVTDALGGVPFGAPDPLWFAHSEPMWLKDRRERHSKDLPLCVLEAVFTPFGHGLGVHFDRPLWKIDVRSVPSRIRQRVRSCLVSEGLPRVRRWLLRPFPSTALEAGPRCRILVQTEQGRVLWEERDSQFADARVEELRCPDSQLGV